LSIPVIFTTSAFISCSSILPTPPLFKGSFPDFTLYLYPSLLFSAMRYLSRAC
jgi:hypothetical protein